MGEEVLNQIEEVSMDMTGNYKSLVKKLCPNADVTVDRFHVTKMIHEELNQARIKQKKAASSLKAKEIAKLLESLKGSKYTLLKAENDLSRQQKLNLKQVKDASPLLGNMHILKEEFHTLFEKSNSWGDGILELTDWLSCSASKTHIVWYNMMIFRKSQCLLKTSSVPRQRKLCNKH